MLEPDAMKVARPVLRGLEAGNGLRLLDRSDDGPGGSGNGNKRMPVCNGLDRGSNFAST